MLARTNDTDGDGLSDAIEALVTHTDPNTPDPNPFPVVTSQPLSQTVYWGDTVTFTIQASGMLPLNYQWQFTPTGGTATNINGATGPSFSLNNIDDTAGGSYFVQVWNLLGWTVSSNAVLTVAGSSSALTLVGPRQDYRFKGDTTYYVDGSTGPVELYGKTVIEGGAVIKYSTNTGAKLVIKGPLECQTSPWGPAIFTAQDDDTVGWWLSFSTGTPTNSYAAVALELASGEDTLLSNIRIAYAQTAVHYLGSTNRQVVGAVRHVQLLHCGAGFVSEGTTNQACVLNLANVLMTDMGQAVGGSHFRGSAEHLTVDRCTAFASDTSSSALGFFVTNSVFGEVTSLGSGVGLDGSNNGFYQGQSPQFGAGQVADDQPPFAPTGGVDEYNVPYLYFVNGQGAYYLRDGSPFEGAGATNIDASLSSDFAQMTTAVPPDLFSDDVNSSMTLGPTAIRDPLTANLGYHYPVVDHVLMLATVNNATLNIDQGTVLALAGNPSWSDNWGLRLNPGGRLNVNGVPTNRVVCAHLEAVQESPVWDFRPRGPMITWRELHFASGPATPYPEAKIQYADFPTLSGGWNGHFDAISSYLSLSYSIITSLELNGCHLQGGWFFYDDGGPVGRALKLRNTVFDRCAFWLYDAGAYEEYFNSPGYSAQVTAVNNLFYQCFMELAPVAGSGAGASWTFTDSLFDNAFFATPDYYNSFLNGPVGVNHHNAYVGMSNVPNGGGRLSPAAPTTTDPDLPSLAYDAGSLGQFYLPAGATNLVGKGSRTAAAAGAYHFTCLTNNQKEAAGQVSIGPHYLALVSGAAPDSNGDGIPDFIADRNGDGLEATDEVPWQSQNSGVLAILSPASNSIVSGIIQLRVNPGTNATGVHLAGYVDGQSLPGIIGVNDPAQSTRDIEIDTSWLTNGAHIFSVRVFSGADTISSPGTQSIDSAPIMLITSNRVTQANWQARAQLSLTVNLQGPSSVSNYAVTFFGVGYPKAQDPFGSCTFDLGVTTDGGMIYTNSPQQLGFGAGDTDPVIYSFTEFTAQPWGGASAPGDISMANPVILNDPPYPPLGEWVATYDDASVDYTLVTSAWFPVSDKQDLLGNFWVHGDQLNNGWLATGWFAGTDGTVAFPPDEDSNPTNSPAGQTWPIRGAESIMNPVGFHNDLLLFGNTLLDPSVRNFYGVGHGNPDQFMWLTGGPLPQRYRFAFLDGCESYSYANFSMFGAVQAEVQPQNASDDSNAGFVDTSYYESTGLRPAAFMGNVVNTKYCYPLDPQHPDLFYTSRHEYKVCYVRDIEALGNWHGQFLSYWMNVGWPLLMSKQQADILAWEFTDGFFAPNPPPSQYLAVGQDANGYPQYYSPITALKVAGFMNLRFNQFNHATDTW